MNPNGVRPPRRPSPTNLPLPRPRLAGLVLHPEVRAGRRAHCHGRSSWPAAAGRGRSCARRWTRPPRPPLVGGPQ
eukprot:9359393-Alexandrium_andersonii.AAC.1